MANLSFRGHNAFLADNLRSSECSISVFASESAFSAGSAAETLEAAPPIPNIP
jgi:hypothetical protein